MPSCRILASILAQGSVSMRIVRYHYQNQTAYGVYENDCVTPINGDIFGAYTFGEPPLPLSAVQLLAPIIPRQLFAIGLNYHDHVGELDFAKKLPTEPISFIAASSAVIGPNEAICLNDRTSRIDAEAELVAVIGKPCYQVSEAEALAYVLGYTCGNDVSNRDMQSQDGQWFRGKSYPTYKPLGPWIETDLDPSALAIEGRVNGRLVQSSNTQHLLFSVAKLISFLSAFTPLEAGDCIMTGTPQGVTQLHPADLVEVTIEGIGTLSNPVR